MRCVNEQDLVVHTGEASVITMLKGLLWQELEMNGNDLTEL